MVTATERDVSFCVFCVCNQKSFRIVFIGARLILSVSMNRVGGDHHKGSGSDRLAADFHILHRSPGKLPHRRVEAQGFVDHGSSKFELGDALKSRGGFSQYTIGFFSKASNEVASVA